MDCWSRMKKIPVRLRSITINTKYDITVYSQELIQSFYSFNEIILRTGGFIFSPIHLHHPRKETENAKAKNMSGTFQLNKPLLLLLHFSSPYRKTYSTTPQSIMFINLSRHLFILVTHYTTKITTSEATSL